MTVFVIILILLVAWLLALEIRFHGLKGLANESVEMAREAAADARGAIRTVSTKIKK